MITCLLLVPYYFVLLRFVTLACQYKSRRSGWIKRQKEGRKREQSAKFELFAWFVFFCRLISPLMMSPECLLGQPFNEKSDVYSFGLILWELYTRYHFDLLQHETALVLGASKFTVPNWFVFHAYRQILFPEVSTEEELIEVVCNKRRRPAIPADCPKSLANLMQACWDHDPNNRVSEPKKMLLPCMCWLACWLFFFGFISHLSAKFWPN